jgi:hypothetical protein
MKSKNVFLIFLLVVGFFPLMTFVYIGMAFFPTFLQFSSPKPMMITRAILYFSETTGIGLNTSAYLVFIAPSAFALILVKSLGGQWELKRKEAEPIASANSSRRWRDRS